MSVFLQSLLTTSLQGSIVIVIVLLLRRILRRAPKRILCLLWLLAALRLLMPFQIESRFSLQPDIAPSIQQQFFPDASVVPEVPDPIPSPTQSPAGSAPAVTPEPSAPSADVSGTTQPASGIKRSTVCVWIWSAGTVGMLSYGVISYLLLRRRVSDAVILSEGVWITRLNTAMVLGFFRPQIYLHAEMAEDQREFVLRHEQCHIRRGDHWWKPLGFFILCIHWYNPLVWLGYACFCRDLEMACDESVIRDLDISQRKSYSAALLSCSARPRSIAACPVAFGEVSVKERIFNVLHYKKPTFWIIMVAVVAILAVAVSFLTSPTAPHSPQAEEFDDWGIRVTPGNVTSTSLILRFEQDGAGEEQRYLYTSEFSLDYWNGSEWAPVPFVSAPTFTKELLSLNNNGTTDIALQWEAFYGPLPAGTYRANKTISRPDGESRVYHVQFLVLQDSINTPGESKPPRELSNGDRNTLRILQQAFQRLRERSSIHCIMETSMTGYPPQTGTSDEFLIAGDTWYRHHKVHMTNTATNWSSGNMLLDGTQYRYGHAGHTAEDRQWTPALEHQKTSTVWFLHVDLIVENIMTVLTTYTADTIEITLYMDGPGWESQIDIMGHVMTFTLDRDWNLLSVKETGTMLHVSEGMEYYVYFTGEIRVLDTEEAQIQQWLDAFAAEIKKDNP